MGGLMEVTWRDAAASAPVRLILVRVRKIRRERGGLFGLFRSPSVAGWIPEAHILEGVAEGETYPSTRVRAMLPGVLVEGVETGELIVLGLDADSSCLCVLRPPAGMSAAEVPGWAAAQPCG